MTWTLASFNFYLLTFFLKYFPGNIYVNSLVFAASDVVAFLSSGIFMQYMRVANGYLLANAIGLVGGLSFVFTQGHLDSIENDWIIPVIVSISRIGCSMNFNLGYVSTSRLFPT